MSETVAFLNAQLKNVKKIVPDGTGVSTGELKCLQEVYFIDPCAAHFCSEIFDPLWSFDGFRFASYSRW